MRRNWKRFLALFMAIAMVLASGVFATNAVMRATDVDPSLTAETEIAPEHTNAEEPSPDVSESEGETSAPSDATTFVPAGDDGSGVFVTELNDTPSDDTKPNDEEDGIDGQNLEDDEFEIEESDLALYGAGEHGLIVTYPDGTPAQEGVDYSWSSAGSYNGNLELIGSNPVVISQTDTSKIEIVAIKASCIGQVVFNGVTITAPSGQSAITVEAGAQAQLGFEGASSFVSSTDVPFNVLGSASISESGSVTITATGSVAALYVAGGQFLALDSASLTVTNSGSGPAIQFEGAGTCTMTSGRLEANAGSGIAIDGGTATLNINGGSLIANTTSAEKTINVNSLNRTSGYLKSTAASGKIAIYAKTTNYVNTNRGEDGYKIKVSKFGDQIYQDNDYIKFANSTLCYQSSTNSAYYAEIGAASNPKASISANPVGNTSLVANGSAQNLIASVGTVTGGTLLYSVNNGSYQSTAMATAPGTYTIRYYIQGDASHTDNGSQEEPMGTITAKINGPSGPEEVTVASIPAVTYNGQAQEPTLTITRTSGGDPLSVGADYSVVYANNKNAGQGKATITYNGNFTGPTEATFTINKASVTVTPDDGQTKVYGEADPASLTYTASPSLVTGDSFTGALSRATGENAGSYNITQGTLSAGDNYAISFTSGKTFTITEKSIAGATIQLGDALYFTGQEQTQTIASVTLGGKTLQAGTDYQVQGTTDKATEVNDHYTLIIEGIGNYNGTEQTAFSVQKASPEYTAPTGKSGLTYTGVAQALVQGASVTGGDMMYSVNGGGYSTAIPEGTQAGSYEISYYVKGDASHGDIKSASDPIDWCCVLIGHMSMTDSALNITGTYEYNGSAQTPTYTVKDGEADLSASTDYTATITNNTNAGRGKVSIVFKGNYQGTVEKEFQINPATVTVTPNDGQNKGYGEADPTFTYTSTPALASGNSFSGALSREAGESVGTYPITQGTLSAGDNYAISFTSGKTFAITEKTIAGATIQLGDALYYTGQEQTQTIASVTLDGHTLQAGTDYQVKDNSNKATEVNNYTLIIEGIGNYNGTAQINFSVQQARPEYTAPTGKSGLTYTGVTQALLQGASVTGGDMMYSVNGEAYSTAIPEGTEAGDYEISYYVKGDASHGDIKSESDPIDTITVSIAKKVMTDNALNITGTYEYNGSAQTPTYTVKDGALDLSATTDYTVTITNNTNAGKGKVSVVFKGNYQGTVEKEFQISPKALTEANVSMPDGDSYPYTGEKIEPTILVKDGINTLTANTDYTVAYENNTSAGTASAVVTMKGNYSGEVTLPYTITKAGKGWVTEPQAVSGLSYDGNEQEIATAGTAQIGTVQYRLDGGAWGTQIPKVKDAGTYTVEYFVEGTDDYDGISAQSFTVTIDPIQTSNLSRYDFKVTLGRALFYDGTMQTQEVVSVSAVRKSDGKEIIFGTDEYIIADNQQKDAGMYQLTITPDSQNFIGSALSYPYHIAEIDEVKEDGSIEIGTNGGGLQIDIPTPTDGAPVIDVSNPVKDIVEMLLDDGHISGNDLIAMVTGETLTIHVTVGNTVLQDEKTAITQKTSQEGYTVGLLLDISIIKSIAGQEVGKVTELSEPLELSFEVPSTLQKEDRTYQVYRLHETEVIALDTTFASPLVIFKSDRYSAYALAYRDKEEPTEPENPVDSVTPTNPTDPSSPTSPTNPTSANTIARTLLSSPRTIVGDTIEQQKEVASMIREHPEAMASILYQHPLAVWPVCALAAIVAAGVIVVVTQMRRRKSKE